MGFNFDRFCHIFNPNSTSLETFNSNLTYLFLILLFLLYYFQKRSLIKIVPYIHLPIERSKIIYYVLILTLFNFFNLGFLLFVVPFSVTGLFPIYGMAHSIVYLTGIFLILMFVSYFVLLLKNLREVSSVFGLLPIGILFLVFLLRGVFHMSFETMSNNVFLSLLKGNFLIILITFLSIIGHIIVNFLLIRNTIFYRNSPDIDLSMNQYKSKKNFLNSNLFWYGLLEIKLISRNKRLKLFFISSVGFLFLLFYSLQHNHSDPYFSFIIFILLNGIFGYIYSQYLFSWESSYFDFILSTKFDIIKCLKAKHIIYVALGFVVFLFFLPLMFQKIIDTHLFITALLFNSCIGYYVLFFMATFNRSRIDLNGKVFFNYQGYNGIQFISIFLVLILPCFILLLLTSIMNFTMSLLIINFISVCSLLHHKIWFRIILKQLNKRKYINMEGYRK